MAFKKSRDSLETVTLPILVPAGNDAQGAFESGLKMVNVRVIKTEEIANLKPTAFQANSWELFRGLAMLKHAYEVNDEWELREAMVKLRPWLPNLPGTVVRPREKLWAAARWDYTSLTTTALEDARLVMWFKPEKKRQRILSPAVYCPDLKTAAFVGAYLGGVRVCPKCHTPFVPAADNVAYCTPSHGVAHRTARSKRKLASAKLAR